MPVNTSARSLSVVINGTDYSEYVSQLEIGFDSYAQGSGLILKKGTITLQAIVGGDSLDPRDNADFAPGSSVSITWNGNPHPLGGSLLVLTVPAISLLNESVPFQTDNLQIAIPVGCTLAFYRTREFDDDKTGVTYANPLTVGEVVNNLLEAAEVPSAKLLASPELLDREINFPFGKNGGGFVDLSGEFAYVGISTDVPCFLYCDNTGVVSFNTLDLSIGSPDIAITLGTDDREYLPQPDLTIAPGIVQVAGVKRNITDTTSLYPFKVESLENSGDRATTTITTYFKFEEEINPATGAYIAPIIPSELPPRVGLGTGYGFNEFSTIYDGGFFGGSAYNQRSILSYLRNTRVSISVIGFLNIAFLSISPPASARHTGVNETTFGYQIIGQITDTVVDGVQVGRNYSAKYYDASDKLSMELSVSQVQAGQYRSERSSLPVEYSDELLVPSQIEIKGYGYDADGNVTRRELVRARNFFEVLPGYNFTNIFEENYFRVVVQSVQIETWEKVEPTRYRYSLIEYVPLVVNNLDSVVLQPRDNPGDFTVLGSCFAPVVKARRSSFTPDEFPPKAEYWEGRYSEEQENLVGEVTFGTGTNVKRYTIQSPFAFSKDHLETIGDYEGRIINGRQYQALIECDPDLFASISNPLPLVSVTEPDGVVRYYLADAITWVHDRFEDYVGFAGIYLQSSAGTPQSIASTLSLTGQVTLGGSVQQDLVSGVLYG